MLLLDKEGRLFGLINLIDLLVLLVVLALLAGAGYQIFLRRAKSADETVRFEFIAPAVRPEIAQAVKAGDLLNSVNSVNWPGSTLPGGGRFGHPVRITSVRVRRALFDVTTAAGTRIMTTDPYLKDVIIWCQAKTAVSGGSVELAGTRILAGEDLILASNSYQLNGYVLQVRIG